MPASVSDGDRCGQNLSHMRELTRSRFRDGPTIEMKDHLPPSSDIRFGCGLTIARRRIFARGGINQKVVADVDDEIYKVDARKPTDWGRIVLKINPPKT